jgi:hypothetical protein
MNIIASSHAVDQFRKKAWWSKRELKELFTNLISTNTYEWQKVVNKMSYNLRYELSCGEQRWWRRY